MLLRRLGQLSVLATLSLTSCVVPPKATDQLVQVPIIFGALKCAFAQALIRESAPGAIRRLKGAVAAGTLTLKLVNTDETGFNIKAKASGPFVFSFAGAGASITPSFSNTVTRTDTITTTIDFRFLLTANNDEVCASIESAKRARYGFSEWLAKIIEGSNANVPFDPPGQIDKLSYTSEFGVVSKDEEGLDFDIVFLSAGLSASQTRNDVQTITFTIAPPSEDNPPPTIYRRPEGAAKMAKEVKDKGNTPAPKPPGGGKGGGGGGPKPGLGPLKETDKIK